jgi:hypothetical protein
MKFFLVTQGSPLTRATLGWMLRTPSAFFLFVSTVVLR